MRMATTEALERLANHCYRTNKTVDQVREMVRKMPGNDADEFESIMAIKYGYPWF